MVPVSLHTVPARDASVQMSQTICTIDVSVIPIFVISASRRCSISLNGRYGVFNKLKSIFSVVCDFFNRGVDPLTAPLALEYGVPHHSVRKSRLSGVARAKRMARKLRNRRRSRA